MRYRLMVKPVKEGFIVQRQTWASPCWLVKPEEFQDQLFEPHEVAGTTIDRKLASIYTKEEVDELVVRAGWKLPYLDERWTLEVVPVEE